MTGSVRRRTSSDIVTSSPKVLKLENGHTISLEEEIPSSPAPPPPEIQVHCGSMLGINVSVTVVEDPTEQELSERILVTIKETMLKEAGSKEESSFQGISDPWCKLVRSISVLGTQEFNCSVFPLTFCALKNLQSLRLSDHAFSTLPPVVGLLKHLKKISIEHTKLKSPCELSGCEALIHLHLNDNKITSIPRTFASLKNLKTLDIHNNQVKDIAPEISVLENLEYLNLSNNRISRLHADLHTLKNLQYLDISNNSLGSGLRNRNPLAPIPGMESLTHLDVSNNKLCSCPSLENLRNLGTMNFNGNLLSEFPVVKNLQVLEVFSVSGNQITSIPDDSFEGLNSLRSLDLSNNKLENIPASIEQVPLKVLYISQNKLSVIPDTFANLSSLSQLDISFNDLVILQDGIFCQLNNLKVLNLKNNRLTRLPDDFFTMPSIEDINLTDNSLQILPEESSSTSKHLVSLALSKNQLLTVPEYFSSFPLQALELHENPIQSLPIQLCEMESLSRVSVFNVTINATTKDVTVLPPTQSSPSEHHEIAAVEHLIILARHCPHKIFILGLSELAGNSFYQPTLLAHLETFVFFLSLQDNVAVIEAIRALGFLSLTPQGRITMSETPLLLHTLIALANRDEEENIPLVTQALKTIANLCLYNPVGEIIRNQLDLLIEREANHPNEELRDACRKILSGVGYTGHLWKRLSHLSEKRGIRILCMDGGGTKSVSTVTILQEIEKRTGKKIYELFDFICGTSVGGILSGLLGIACLDATEVSALQKRTFKEIFNSGNKSEGFVEKFALLSNLFSTGGRYNTPMFEKILKDIFGDETLIDSSSKLETKKIDLSRII